MRLEAGGRSRRRRASVAALVESVGLARAIGSGLMAVSAGIGLATLEDGKLAIALALTATCAHGLLLALRPQERLAIRLHVGVATLSAVIAVLARSPVAPSLVALTAVAAFALPRRRATWALTLSVTGLYLLVAGPRLDALWPLSLVIGGYLLADLGQRASAIFDAELARRREAEAASIAKEDFLSNVSHEIRTPMSGILGMADAMLRRPLAANVREPIEVMRRSAEAVLTIVEEILDFSKISAVGITLHTNRFDLRQLISEVIALHRPVAEAKGLRLRTQIAVGLPRLLHGDPGRLRQVITNLISNAIKFTQQGWVELTVEGRIDGEVCQTRVRVADSGHGIPLDLLDRIFDPFVQGTEDTERRGTGLGLAIARRIILALGGTITAESAVGEGSTFVIDVPLKVVRKELSAPTSTATTVKAPQAAGAPAAAPTAAPTTAAEAPPQSAPPAAPTTAAEAPRLRRARVLVVDDDPINQVVATAQLEELGHEVTVVGGGLEALERLHDATFDLVLMDCQMPDLDGFETTRALREREGEGRRTPVIALTANASIDISRRCAAAGMDGHLGKPTRLDALERAIERWLPRDAG